jgi:hypothetical protein
MSNRNDFMRPRQPGETLPEVIRRRVLEWDQWSRAERRRLDEIVDSVIDHCSEGNGNGFIQWWCLHNLADLFQQEEVSGLARDN